MKQFKKLSSLCSMLCISVIFGQQNQMKSADKKFQDLAFVDAREIYEELAEKDWDTANTYLKLADTYYKNAQYLEASQWYEKLYKNVSAPPIDVLFRYGQSVKATGNYNKADLLLQRYYQSQGHPYVQADEYLSKIEKHSGRFTIEVDSGHANGMGYPAFLRKDTLYLVLGGAGMVMNAWNKKTTSDIFIGDGTKVKPLPGKVNSKYNEGTMVVTKDGQTLYFTRNDFSEGTLGADLEKVHRLKIYKATWSKKHKKWEDITELPFNDSRYSFGHPALSPKEDKLYFVSDMPHTKAKGGTDLYVVDILKDGAFGTPKNMEPLNTIGNEMFPFIAMDGTLYFSSNGHSSLGGLDVFQTSPDESGTYGAIYNVGKPVNSSMDDFAFKIQGSEGYFASNRNGAKDSVFKISEIKPFEEPCSLLLLGSVWDNNTGDALESVEIRFFDDKDNEIHKIYSDGEGEFKLGKVDCQSIATVRSSSPGYLVYEMPFKPSSGEETHLGIAMQPETPALPPGLVVGDMLDTIFFDFDDDRIRGDARKRLYKIIETLKKYPQLKIDIRAHTDSRGSEKYNLILSERRARESMEYLIENGKISPERITGKGYGESQLLEHKCSNGVKCSEAEHRRNRRAELVVIE